MANWKFGASAKEFDKLAEYARNFELLEVDLEKAVPIAGTVEDVHRRIEPYQSQLYSVHLRYEPEDGLSGIEVMLRDITLISSFGAKISITHTEYPLTPEQLKEQLKIIGDQAAQLGVYVAIENIGDRQNKTRGCIWPRDPCRIAEILEGIGNEHIGLCLDTGHAIGNRVTYWNRPEMMKWIKHVHYNDNQPLKDEHYPVGPNTDRLMMARLKHLTQTTTNIGVIVLEHRKLSEAIQSMDYIRSPAYAIINPSP